MIDTNHANEGIVVPRSEKRRTEWQELYTESETPDSTEDIGHGSANLKSLVLSSFLVVSPYEGL